MPDILVPLLTNIGKRTGINKAHQYFLLHVLELFLGIASRINFMNLSRHVNLHQEPDLGSGFGRFMDIAALNQDYCQLHPSICCWPLT